MLHMHKLRLWLIVLPLSCKFPTQIRTFVNWNRDRRYRETPEGREEIIKANESLASSKPNGRLGEAPSGTMVSAKNGDDWFDIS
jgi:hypothetical protein